jgi:hypothetical protein
MASKRQTTMAKIARERRVQEKRERKREKKQAAAAAKLADTEGPAEGDVGADSSPVTSRD